MRSKVKPARLREGSAYLNRVADRGIGGAGRASEARQAAKLGARLTANSGAASIKGDARLKGYAYSYRMEMKSTQNLALGLDLGWLAKISEEARAAAEVPALVFTFVTPEGRPRLERNAEWVAIPRWHFEELKERCSTG